MDEQGGVSGEPNHGASHDVSNEPNDVSGAHQEVSGEADATSMAYAAAEAAAAAEQEQVAAEQAAAAQQAAAQQAAAQQAAAVQTVAQQAVATAEEQVATATAAEQAAAAAMTEQQVAAAPAVSESASGEAASLTCRICGKGDDGRTLVSFQPVEVDLSVTSVAPSVTTFTEQVTLHVFCGKTASILPTVNAPQYEILSKAGIKNKHGIGSEVNAALARTRCAIVETPGAKEKYYYIVQEFEANLAAVRSTHPQQAYAYHPEYYGAPSQSMQHLYAPAAPAHELPPVQQQQQQQHHASHQYPATTTGAAAAAAPLQPEASPPTTQHQHIKPAPPVRAPAGMAHKYVQNRRKDDIWVQPDLTVTPDGKIRCACGGTHLPTGTAKGAASWRSHVMTKRHQRWMEENGLTGAV